MDIRYIFFDLDDTLYTNASGLFAEVGRRIESWTANALGISVAEARALRSAYFKRYGTTMAGLVQEHPEVDVDAYLNYVHDIDVSPFIDPNPELDRMLADLPVTKVLFTNSIASWAEQVTSRLGVRHHFERIVDVRAVGYHSKPDARAFAWVLQTFNVNGPACVMVDDQLSYLRGAAAAGMHTVWVHPESAIHPAPPVDHAVSHILEAGPVLQQLLANHR